MENIIMTEGIANQFKTTLQETYDYLDQCSNAIDNCRLLSKLGIMNNNIILKNITNEQKNTINKLLNNISIYEKNVIDIDNQHAKELEELDKENPGEITKTTNKTSTNTNIDNQITIESYSIPNNEPQTNIHNNYIEFSTNFNDMIEAGDIFANTEYNITSYTNFLLYKYQIKDEAIAKEIYQALTNYGKNYYQNNNGANPILKQDETTILIEIYNILKEKEDFNINHYPIFKNLDITKI